MSSSAVAILAIFAVPLFAFLTAFVTVRYQSRATVTVSQFDSEMKRLAAVRDEADSARKELEELREQESSRVAARLIEVQRLYEELEARCAVMERELVQTTDKVERQTALIERQSANLTEKDAEIVRVTARMRDLETALADAQMEIRALKAGKT